MGLCCEDVFMIPGFISTTGSKGVGLDWITIDGGVGFPKVDI